MKLVQCAHCGAQNRVGGYSLSRTAICGKCHIQLPEPFYLRSARIAAKYKYWIVLGVIVGGAELMDEFKSSSKSSFAGTRTNYQDYSPPFRATVNYPAVPVTQGIHQLFTNAEQIAPFRIVTPSGPESYYVKLTDAFTGALVMTFFVYGASALKPKCHWEPIASSTRLVQLGMEKITSLVLIPATAKQIRPLSFLYKEVESVAIRLNLSANMEETSTQNQYLQTSSECLISAQA